MLIASSWYRGASSTLKNWLETTRAPVTHSIRLTWPLVVVAASTLAIEWRSFRLPFSLIDDGVDIQEGRALGSAILQLDVGFIGRFILGENGIGRFRPIFWLMAAIQDHFFGLNPAAYHIFRVVIFVAAALMVFGLVRAVSHSPYAGLLGALLFVLWAPVSDNWSRLGPLEPWLLVLQLGCILALRNGLRPAVRTTRLGRRVWLSLSLALYAFSLLTKETASAFLAVPSALLVASLIGSGPMLRDRRRSLGMYTLVAVVLTIAQLALVRASLRSGPSYATNYHLSLSPILHHAHSYVVIYFEPNNILLVGAVAFASLAIGMGRAIGRKRLDDLTWWSLAIAAWGAGWFAIMLPWDLIIGYYLLPFWAAFSIFVALQATRLGRGWRLLHAHRTATAIVVMTLLVVSVSFVKDNIAAQQSMLSDLLVRDQAASQMIDFVASHTPRNGTVETNIDPVAGLEWQVEIGFHLHYLHSRPDITVEPIDRLDLAQFPPGAIVVAWNNFTRFTWDQIQTLSGPKLQVLEVVHRGNYQWTIAQVSPG